MSPSVLKKSTTTSKQADDEKASNLHKIFEKIDKSKVKKQIDEAAEEHSTQDTVILDENLDENTRKPVEPNISTTNFDNNKPEIEGIQAILNKIFTHF